MPDTFIQQQSRLRQRRREKNVDFAQGSVFLGVITGDHISEKEKVGVSYHAGQRELPTLHPYLGPDSWIRTAAEGGQPVLAAQRPDSADPELLAYTSKDEDTRIRAYLDDRLGLYRPLFPGEIETHSKGLAQSFYGRRPLLSQRGGLIRSWLDQDRLESGARAPLHVRHLSLKRSGQLGDEERLGIVARPDDSGTVVSKVNSKYVRADRVISPTLGASFIASSLAAGVTLEPGPWAKEYLRILRSGAIYPEKLVDIREGDVIDDSGNVINLTSSGKPLRYKGEWFADSLLGGAFFVGIDQDGNFSVSAPDEASVGGTVTVPAGDLTLTLGASHTVQVQTDYSLATSDGTMTLDAQTGYQLTVPDGSISLLPSATLDVGGADEPAVLGNRLLDFLGQLLDLFGQHFHTGNMGGPTPLEPGAVAQVQQLKASFVDQKTLISDYINLSKKP